MGVTPAMTPHEPSLNLDRLCDRLAAHLLPHFTAAIDAWRRPNLSKQEVKTLLRITRDKTLRQYERLGLPHIQIRPNGPHLYPRRALHMWLWKFAKGDPATLLEAAPDPTPQDLDALAKGWVAEALARKKKTRKKAGP